MKKFNLKKRASSEYDTISDKRLDKNRQDMNLSNEQQGVVEKNINLSISKKDKDNTVPFNQQLEASRKNNKDFSIIESKMKKDQSDFKSKDKKQVTDINVESRRHMDDQSKAYSKAEDSSKSDTEFWDKYVGVQLEGEMKKIDNNVSSSQLQNAQGRFDGDKINKMVMASIKDADAMLFHIYAMASKEGRNLTDHDRQKVVDINSGKARILSSTIKKSSDPIIRSEGGVIGVYEADGTKIDEFTDLYEAKINYPEGDIQVG